MGQFIANAYVIANLATIEKYLFAIFLCTFGVADLGFVLELQTEI